MKDSLTKKIIIFLADWFGFNSHFNWQDFFAVLKDPRMRRHQEWVGEYLHSKRKRKKLYNAIKTLERRGFLEKKVLKENSRGYIFSGSGEGKVLRLKIKMMGKKKNADGSWILVLFDIPEKLRKSRDLLRRSLHALGFEQMQKSVWVSPYDVAKELKEIIERTGLKEFVKFILVKEFDYQPKT